MQGKLDQDRALALQCLLAGGDDYELCFTASAADRNRVMAAGAASGLAVTRIGAITREAGLHLVDERGEAIAPPRAFDHFAA
jgi:thiamine-monophosphate kinase